LTTSINIKTPGRICLFGDHQDYLGLPVIACAIDRFVFLSSELNSANHFHIRMPNINEERIIPISETFDTLDPGDHLASTLRVVHRYGCHPDRGYNVEFNGTLPINAGVSSSSALVVAWTHFLLQAFGCRSKITPQLIAQIAYEAEVVEHNSPGGNMDQFAVAIGEVLLIETGANFSTTCLGSQLPGLVLGDSGIPKETIGLLTHLREKAQSAISEITKNQPLFDINTAKPQDIPSLLAALPEHLKPYLEAAIRNHDITQKALREFQKETRESGTIGTLMSEHHAILRDLLKITVPQIDVMIEAALDAGAYGAKIVGSGGGGSIVAIAPPENVAMVEKALLKAGAVSAFEVNVAGGTKITHP
jgi:galactokinase